MSNLNSPPLGYLIIRSGQFAGRRVIINQAAFAIGRDQRCNLRPPDPAISPLHAIIHYRNGKFYVQDRHSEHGTTLNGKRVDMAPLKAGDRLKIGLLELEFMPAEKPAPQVSKPLTRPTTASARMIHYTPEYPGESRPSSNPTAIGYEIISSPRSAYDDDEPLVPRPDSKPKRSGNSWIGGLYAIAFVVVGVLALILVGSELMGNQEVSISSPANFNSSGATLLYFYADW